MEWIEVPDEGLSLRQIREITKRSQSENSDIRKSVEDIISAVQERGDDALRDLTEKFDGVRLDTFRVTTEEIEEATKKVGPHFMEILEEARDNIKAYHERQLQDSWMDTFRDGVRLGAKITPIQRVGVYVPGGTAAYPSTVLMDTVPAHVAGVPSIAVFTPPAKMGPSILIFWQQPMLLVQQKSIRLAVHKVSPQLLLARNPLSQSLKLSGLAMRMWPWLNGWYLVL